MEKLKLTSQRSYLGLHTVGENEKGVVIKKMGNRIQIIGVVIRVGILHIYCVLLQLHEKQWDAIDKAHDVCPATVIVAVDFHLFNSEKKVSALVGGMLKVNDLCIFDLCPATRFPHRDRDTVANQRVFLLVDLHKGCGREGAFHLPLGLVYLCGANPRIEGLQSGTEITGQKDFLVRCSPEGTVFT